MKLRCSLCGGLFSPDESHGPMVCLDTLVNWRKAALFAFQLIQGNAEELYNDLDDWDGPDDRNLSLIATAVAIFNQAQAFTKEPEDRKELP